jgi:hypothetical protein
MGMRSVVRQSPAAIPIADGAAGRARRPRRGISWLLPCGQRFDRRIAVPRIVYGFRGTTVIAPLFSKTAYWASSMQAQPVARSAAFNSWCVSRASRIACG